MSLLGSVGFGLYQSDPENLTSQLSTLTSPILSPLSHGTDEDLPGHLLDLSSTNPISTESGAVLTRSRSGTNTSSRAGYSPRTLSRERMVSHIEGSEDSAMTPPGLNGHSAYKPSLVRSSSHSPSGCEVSVLDPDLTCIGLSDDNADVWGLKIIKLVAYPDLISVVQPSPARASVERRPSLHADELPTVPPLGVRLAAASDMNCDLETDSEAEDTEQPSSTSDTESENTDGRSDSLTRVGDSPIDSRASSQSPIFELEMPHGQDVELDSERSDDELSQYASPAAFPLELNEVDDMKVLKHHSRSPRLLHIDTDKTYKAPHTTSKRRTSRRTRSSPSPPPPPLVPFFSFTRTPEGSSLTAPVNLLAALFPSSERHMVICSGELDVLDSRAASPDIPQGDSEEDSDEENSRLAETQGTLKCLQIDLTKFGLGEYTMTAVV